MIFEILFRYYKYITYFVMKIVYEIFTSSNLLEN